MLDIFIHSLAGFLILFGCYFVVTGGWGLLRLPSFFTRVHAASLTDTGGASLILLGLMLIAFSYPTAIWLIAKLLMLLCFLFFTSPTAAHALAKSALRSDKPLIDFNPPDFNPPGSEQPEAKLNDAIHSETSQ